MLLRRLGKANQFFANQVVESALCAEPSTDPPRGSALLNPDLLESHPHQPIRNSCLAATTKLHTVDGVNRYKFLCLLGLPIGTLRKPRKTLLNPVLSECSVSFLRSMDESISGTRNYRLRPALRAAGYSKQLLALHDEMRHGAGG